MKGCGGKFLSFVVGFVMGIVFVFGAVFGTVYVVATQTKISSIENAVNKSDTKYTDGAAIGGMSLYDVFNTAKEMFSDGKDPSIAALQEKFGLDLVGLLEDKLNIAIDGNDVYVKVEDVSAIAFDSEGEVSADSLDRYVFNAETKTFERVVAMTDSETAAVTAYQQVPFGSIYNVRKGSDGKAVLTYKGNDVTERCGVVNGELVTTADGDYYLVNKNAKEALLNTPLSTITSDITSLLDIVNIDLVAQITGATSIKDIKVIAEGSYLPVLVMVDTIMDVVNNIEKKSIADVQDMTGITLIDSDNLLSALIDVPIGKLMDEVEVMEIGKLMKANRDSFVKYTDLQTSAAPAELIEYGNGFKDGKPTDIGKLTLNADSGLYTSDAAHNSALYKWEAKHLGKYVEGGTPALVDDYYVVTATVDGDKTTYSLKVLEGGETAVTSANIDDVYVRVHAGDSILNILSPLTLTQLSSGDFTDLLNDIKISAILGEEHMTGILENFKDTTIGELADKFDTITLGEVIDIYEQDEVDPVTGDVIHEKSPSVLIKFKDTKITELVDSFDDLVLKDVVDIYEEDVIDPTTGDVIHEKSPNVLIKFKDTKITELADSFDDLVLKDVVDVYEQDVVDPDTGDVIHEKSHGVLIKLKDTKVTELADAFDDLVLKDVVDIYEEDVVDSTTGDVVHEKSNKVFIKLQDTKISELATAFDDLVLGDVVDIVEYSTCRSLGKESESSKARAAVASKEEIYIEAGSSPDYETAKAYYVGTCYFMYDETQTGNKWIALVKAVYDENGTIINDGYNQHKELFVCTKEASNPVFAALANVKISEIATQAGSVIDELVLGEVMDIDGDIFEATTYNSSTDDEYFVKDGDMLIPYDATKHASVTNVYMRRYKGTSNAVIKRIATVKVKDLGTAIDKAIDNTYIGELIDITVESVFALDEGGEYVEFARVADEAEATAKYKGTYELMHNADGTVSVMVKYKDGVTTGTRYHLVRAASNAAIASLADKKVGSMADDMQSIVDSMPLSDAMVINGDVFVEKVPATDAEKADLFVYKNDMFLQYDASADADVTIFYERVYEGGANAVLKKLATVSVQNIPSHIELAVDETRLSEMVTISDDSNVVLKKVKDVKIKNLSTEINTAINDSTLGELITIDSSAHVVLQKLKDVKVGNLSTEATEIINNMTIGELVNPTDTNSLLYALKDSTLTSIEEDATNTLKNSSIIKLYTWSGATMDADLQATIELYETAAGRELTVLDFLNGIKVQNGGIYFDPTTFTSSTPTT